MPCARSIRVRGVVQGVGFRPFVYRLARANTLCGWVLNGDDGVEIFVEGAEKRLLAFVRDLKTDPPQASDVTEIEVHLANPVGLNEFTIRESQHAGRPTARISPDLPVCDACLKELFDPADRRYWYPYINCANCGPRYTVILSLPYDRPNTTMQPWPMDEYCAAEYNGPSDRRFHAQPVACPHCGPAYYLRQAEGVVPLAEDEKVRPKVERRFNAALKTFSPVGGLASEAPKSRFSPDRLSESEASIRKAAELLSAGAILTVKGLGGYHLVCDASNPVPVAALRVRKFRKEKPFAIMARDLDVVHKLVDLSSEAETLLTSSARPIILAPSKAGAKRVSPEVAPDNVELGVMLPYTPLHYLLFAAGAPEVLVMTSANRSSEPIAFEDEEALDRLSEIADAFLIGQRRIARRVDDSIARDGVFGPVILRRARGYAPNAVATFPRGRPILAVGADLKNSITLVVDGQAFVSHHIGDLAHHQSLHSFHETIQDLIAMYEVQPEELRVAYDSHPQYASASHALSLTVPQRLAVQHHRAHIASVLAERGEWRRRVVGVSFDGTGYGDDGSIWGGEIFVGSIRDNFDRVAHLRSALLPGGDAAAQYPVQAAAGFLAQVEGLPDLAAPPFNFPPRFRQATQLVQKSVRSFSTTSVGRLFDTAAALLGFTREITFEGQAAMWLEQLASAAPTADFYPFTYACDELDFRPLLQALVRDRLLRRPVAEIARAFHLGVAKGASDAVTAVSKAHAANTVVLSGGVFQNELLLKDLKTLLEQNESLQVWTNHAVPPNDGGISLGQAALAVFAQVE